MERETSRLAVVGLMTLGMGAVASARDFPFADDYRIGLGKIISTSMERLSFETGDAFACKRLK